MNIKAVAFDVGNTLVYYNHPLNWQALYPFAIRKVMEECNFIYTKEADETAQRILTKYNTRVNFREYEVSSDIIFSEILNSWDMNPDKLETVKNVFFGFFQKGAACYDDTECVLCWLKNKGIKIGVLTDAAYGMDNKYSLVDIEPIKQYIDICLTSIDVGYRKPNKAGYSILQKSFDIPFKQTVFIGDEEKDIIGANNARMISILINRSNIIKNYSQDYTVNSLTELLKFIN